MHQRNHHELKPPNNRLRNEGTQIRHEDRPLGTRPRAWRNVRARGGGEGAGSEADGGVAADGSAVEAIVFASEAKA